VSVRGNFDSVATVRLRANKVWVLADIAEFAAQVADVGSDNARPAHADGIPPDRLEQLIDRDEGAVMFEQAFNNRKLGAREDERTATGKGETAMRTVENEGPSFYEAVAGAPVHGRDV
jgi:hypothetical protein